MSALDLRGLTVGRCKAWVNKPAINFHFPNHENIFHYLNDALLLVLDTLNDTGLTPPAVARRALPQGCHGGQRGLREGLVAADDT